MDCVVTPLKTLMGFSVHLNVQLKFYNLPLKKDIFAKNDKKHFSKSIGIEVITSIAKHNNITPSDIDW